jgi:hypothetical protein
MHPVREAVADPISDEIILYVGRKAAGQTQNAEQSLGWWRDEYAIVFSVYCSGE